MKRVPLYATHLPLLRDSMIEVLKEGDNRPEDGASGTLQDSLMHGMLAESLLQAQLWWVSKDMSTVVEDAMDSGVEPPEFHPPSQDGLMVFEGTPLSGREIVALTWHFDTKVITPWIENDHPEAHCAIRPLVVDEVGNRELKRVLSFVWSFALEPRLSETRQPTWGFAGLMPRRLSEKDMKEVKIVDLRRISSNSTSDDPSGREYTHRWIVRGHWRNQPCGKQHEDRKKTWVPPYVKGPEGAPLLKCKEEVFVWRR